MIKHKQPRELDIDNFKFVQLFEQLCEPFLGLSNTLKVKTEVQEIEHIYWKLMKELRDECEK